MNNREKFCAWLFEVSKKPYAYLTKRSKKAWKLSSNDLMQFPVSSLAYETGLFLKKNGFELIDKLESHDFYHVITRMSTAVKDEIGMQFLLLGNGKKSLYMYFTVTLSSMLLPEHYRYFKSCFYRGKRYEPIHRLNLLQELNTPVKHLRNKLLKNRSSRMKVFTHLSNHY